MSAAEGLTLSYDTYLALEATTGLRHQYVDGAAYATAGSEPEHANVAANTTAALANPLRGGRCRGDKFADDQRLGSLRHDLLVSTRARRVEHYRRNDDGTWTYAASGVGGSVELPDLGGALTVDDLYVAESE